MVYHSDDIGRVFSREIHVLIFLENLSYGYLELRNVAAKSWKHSR